MTELQGTEKSVYVRDMFSRIARRYDLMNRIMSMGQDGAWRKEVLRHAQITKADRVLDIGAGTGDLIDQARISQQPALAVGADFTLPMMKYGRRIAGRENIRWLGTDAGNLPFYNESFDVVLSGFLLRNVPSVERALAEQFRVLRRGGRVVSLDTTRPVQNILTPLINFHLNVIIPTLGKIITGEADAYRYLPNSTQQFLSAEDLAMQFRTAGFEDVAYQVKMLGTIAIHHAVKK